MKVYKLEVMVLDFDDLGADEIVSVLENQKYPNYCIAPDVMSIEERDCGEWHDDHPLNKHSTQEIEFQRLFNGEK